MPYPEEGHELAHLVRRFVKPAWLSAGSLIVTSTLVALSYGVRPMLTVGHSVRGFVLLVWFWNVCI
jgi:hypothetical protein